MAGFDDVVRIAGGWPGVTIGTSYGTPALLVRQRSFCRMWSDREHARDGVDDTEVLVVFCDVEEKPHLIDDAGGVLFTTRYDDGHGAMLIRLAVVAPLDLRDWLDDSYRRKAPPALVRELDAESCG